MLFDAGCHDPSTAVNTYFLYLISHMFSEQKPESFARMFPLLAEDTPKRKRKPPIRVNLAGVKTE